MTCLIGDLGSENKNFHHLLTWDQSKFRGQLLLYHLKAPSPNSINMYAKNFM